jgi:hypothetical protein
VQIAPIFAFVPSTPLVVSAVQSKVFPSQQYVSASASRWQFELRLLVRLLGH